MDWTTNLSNLLYISKRVAIGRFSCSLFTDTKKPMINKLSALICDEADLAIRKTHP